MNKEMQLKVVRETRPQYEGTGAGISWENNIRKILEDRNDVEAGSGTSTHEEEVA